MQISWPNPGSPPIRLPDSQLGQWIQPLGDIHHWKIPLLIFNWTKLILFIPSLSRYHFKCQRLSNCDVIDMEQLAIVTSHWFIILALFLWTLSSSQWRCQPGRFSIAAHSHDRRGINNCILLHFRGRIEIDHSYGLRCRGLCCHSRHSTCGAGCKRPRDGQPHSCCAGSGSTNDSSADCIMFNSFYIT